jgi:ATP-binding cassette, subfamily B, bacterial PglK
MKKLINLYLHLLDGDERRDILKLQFYVFTLTVAEIVFILTFGDMLRWLEDSNGSSLVNIMHEIGYTAGDSLLIAIYLSLMVLMSSISLLSSWRIAIIPQLVGSKISARLYNYYMFSSAQFHEENPSTLLISKLSQEVSRVTNQILQPLAQMNSSLVLGVVLFGYLLTNYFDATIFGGGVIVSFYLLTYRHINKFLLDKGKTISVTHNYSITLMKDGFQGYIDYLTTNSRKFISGLYSKNIQQFGLSAGLVRAYGILPKFVLESVIVFMAVFYLSYIKLVTEEDLTIATSDIAIIGLIGLKLMPLIHKIYAMLTTIIANSAALQSLEKDLRFSALHKEEIPKYDCKDTQEILLNKKKDVIIFDRVSLTLNNIQVIDNISFSIKRGEKVAFVGESGSGKSTILKILAGIYCPQKGGAYLGDQNYTSISNKILFECVSYTPQKVHISHGTVLDNIAIGLEKDSIDESFLEDVLQQSCLSEVVRNLESGINSEIGEDGATISGGERQRIGIARALFRDTEIILFDEATSALDGNTENHVIKSLLKSPTTLVVVTHRISTLVNFDKIFVVEGGRIVDYGIYDDLNSRCRQFKTLIGAYK